VTPERLKEIWNEAIKDRPDLVPSDIRGLVVEIERLQAELADRTTMRLAWQVRAEKAEKEVEELESSKLRDNIEALDDSDGTAYIHHPKCVGYCDYGCGGLFVDHCEVIENGNEPLLSPRALLQELAQAKERITYLEQRLSLRRYNFETANSEEVEEVHKQLEEAKEREMQLRASLRGAGEIIHSEFCGASMHHGFCIAAKAALAVPPAKEKP